MDGIHDMGGKQGFGRIAVEEDYIFRSAWQRRAFALVEALAWSTPYNTDQHRHAVECVPPADYLRLDYFENWIVASEMLLKEAGLVDQSELDDGRKHFDVDQKSHAPVGVHEIVDATKAGADLRFPEDTQSARFAVGQSVLVSHTQAAGHTRVPRYLRGKTGRIVSDEGVFQFADAVVAGRGPDPQHCYTVVFSAQDLWGEEAQVGDSLCADLWEAYLEPA